MRIITNWKTIGYSDHVRRYVAYSGIPPVNTVLQALQDLELGLKTVTDSLGRRYFDLLFYYPQLGPGFWQAGSCFTNPSFQTQLSFFNFPTITNLGITGGNSVVNSNILKSDFSIPNTNGRLLACYQNQSGNLTNNSSGIVLGSSGSTSENYLIVRNTSNQYVSTVWGRTDPSLGEGFRVRYTTSDIKGVYMAMNSRSSTGGCSYLNDINIGSRGSGTMSGEYTQINFNYLTFRQRQPVPQTDTGSQVEYTKALE